MYLFKIKKINIVRITNRAKTLGEISIGENFRLITKGDRVEN